jgi:hypothetical protein
VNRGRLPDRRLRRELLVAWLHLAILWTFAIAKPLFDVLADEAAFFVARGNTRADILIFAIGLIVIPPTVLVAIEALFFRFEGVRRTLHLLFTAGLIAGFALQLLADDLSASSGVLIPLAAALGGLGAIAYMRARAIRSMLTVLSPVPLLFLVIFLLFSPVSELVLPQAESQAVAAKITSDTPVVMIVLDEFPIAYLMDQRYRIDAERFPNFAKLARSSTWYRNATTVADVTTQAVPAMLSGKRSRRDSLPTESDHPDNLFTLLGRSYALDVHESATQLCPEQLCARSRASISDRLSSLVEDLSIVSLHQLLPDDLDKKLPAVDRTFGGFRGGGDDNVATVATGADAGLPDQSLVNRKGMFQRFLAGLGQPTSRPPLHFLHVQLPHFPWQYLPSGQQYPVNGPDETPGLDGETWTRDPAPVQQTLQRHLLQDGFVDRLIGQLSARLRATGLWEQSLVIITSDHGISFRPGLSRRYVSEGNFGEIANIPLFIKAPGQRAGRIDDSAVRTIDIVPTIARYLGTRLPWKAEGRPAEQRNADPNGPVAVLAYAGGEVSVPFADFKRRRDAVAREIDGLTGNGLGGLYRFGPGANLMGNAVDDFLTGSEVNAQVDFDAPNLFSSVNPQGSVVPAYVTGRITGAVAAAPRLVLAVNGRISAVTDSYRSGEELRFGAMVPPGAFRRGRNTVVPLVLETINGSTQLSALGVGQEAELIEQGEQNVVVLPSGQRIVVAPESITGFIDRLTYLGDQLTVTGWAVDTERRRATDQIMVFSKDGLLVAGRPSSSRPDIAARFGPAAERSGFLLSTFSDQAEELADPSKVRVIAIAGDRASELETAGSATTGKDR